TDERRKAHGAVRMPSRPTGVQLLHRFGRSNARTFTPAWVRPGAAAFLRRFTLATAATIASALVRSLQHTDPGTPMTYRILTRFVAARDGTRIAWHTHLPRERLADGEEVLAARPTIVLTNGIGTSANFWK